MLLSHCHDPRITTRVAGPWEAAMVSRGRRDASGPVLDQGPGQERKPPLVAERHGVRSPSLSGST